MVPGNDLVAGYVNRALASTSEQVTLRCRKANGNPLVERHVVARAWEFLDHFQEENKTQTLLLSGMRGAGKTTAMAQMIERLYKQGIPPSSIAFLSMDEAYGFHGIDIASAVGEIERIRNAPWASNSTPYFLFLDEVHHDPKWSMALKILHDRSARLQIVATSSSAVDLMEQRGDLSRRADVMHVSPMGYREYHDLSGRGEALADLAKDTRKAVFESNSAEECHDRLKAIAPTARRKMLDLGVDRLEHYLQRGSFPFMAERGPRARDFSQLRLALEKTIYDDVARSCGFDRTSSDAVMRLISMLASSESISYEKIGTALNISRATTSKALEALEQAGVITKVRPCGEASRMRLKTPRYKLRATAMRAMLLEDIGRNLTSPEVLGPLLEDAVTELLVQMYTDREVNEICFDQEDGGADLVVATGTRRLAIEVGWGKKDRRQVSKTRAREGCDFSLIVSSQDLRLEGGVVWLPATWFLLM